MKELILSKGGLTSGPQKPYPKGREDIFMEGKSEIPPGTSKSKGPEGQKRPISAETEAKIREALADPNFPIELKGHLKEALATGIPIISGGAQDTNQPQAAGGNAVGREEPNTMGNPAEEPGDGAGKGAEGEDSDQDRAKKIINDLVEGQVSFDSIVGGIADQDIRRQINETKAAFTSNPPDKVDELRKAIEKMSRLERTPTGSEDPDTKREKDRIFMSQKNSVMARLGNLSEILKRATQVLERQEQQESHEGVFGERKLSLGEKERIRNAKDIRDIEDLFNRVFDKVDRRPNTEFNKAFGTVGSYEHDEFMRVLNDAINQQNRAGNPNRVSELEAIVSRLTNEREAREIIHNAYYAVTTGQNTEAMSQFIAPFLTGYADLAFGKAGVVQATHFYEQALLIIREKNGGYLPAKEVIGNLKTNERGEVNILMEELLREANEKGEIETDREGKFTGRKLQKWEIDRALSFARGMSVVTGRSIEIAATSILPGTESGTSAFVDLFAQRIIQELYPFRHGGVKFQTGKDNKMSRVLAYILNQKKSPWTPKEIQDFDKMGFTDQIKVLNDLMPEGKERFFSVLNPFEIGGWLSRTGWRIGGDPHNPGETAIKYMMEDQNERDWIGTGITIERERGKLEKLESKDPKELHEGKEALQKIKEALEQTARVTPLRFFLNTREVKERVLTDLFESDYFTKDEKEAIRNAVNEKIAKREIIKDKKGKIHKKDLPKDTKANIEFEEIMKSTKFSDEMRKLVLLQEKAVLAKDEALVTRESKLGKILHDTFLHGETDVNQGKKETYLEVFVRKLEHKGWKTPFVFGTEDIPFNKYVFEETGPRSGARRWADMAAAAKAGGAFSEFLNGIEHYTEQGQIVEAMGKMYHHIKDYNLEYAEKFTQQLAEGVMKFYGKSWTHRLPVGIGSATAFVKGNSSYAQIAFGRGKMAWDELQSNEFTRLLRDKGLIKVEQQHELQGKAGGGKKEVVWGYTRTVLPLIMLGLMYYMATKIKDDK